MVSVGLENLNYKVLELQEPVLNLVNTFSMLLLSPKNHWIIALFTLEQYAKAKFIGIKEAS
ncbi:hypothetical protein [Mucilaginibacter sp.]|uniref:hypothetical protein n=1 Tax=Mucilaginibacter sp. TaxID=1882438 RepID=UPI003B00DF9A